MLVWSGEWLLSAVVCEYVQRLGRKSTGGRGGRGLTVVAIHREVGFKILDIREHTLSILKRLSGVSYAGKPPEFDKSLPAGLVRSAVQRTRFFFSSPPFVPSGVHKKTMTKLHRSVVRAGDSQQGKLMVSEREKHV